jgi:hypothetical protein
MIENWFIIKQYCFIKSYFLSDLWKNSIKNENKKWILIIEASLLLSNTSNLSLKELKYYLPNDVPSANNTPLPLANNTPLPLANNTPLPSANNTLLVNNTPPPFFVFHQTPKYDIKKLNIYKNNLTKVEYDSWLLYKNVYDQTIFFITLKFYRSYQNHFYEYYNLNNYFDNLFFVSCLKFCHILFDFHINYSALTTYNNKINLKELIDMVENKIFNFLNFKIPSMFTKKKINNF